MKCSQRLLFSLCMVLCCIVALPLHAQTTGTPPAGAASTSGLKPYREVITAQAKSDDGLFTVHRIDEKLFYEIPNKLLGKEMLLITRISKTPAVSLIGDEGTSQVVKWERKFNRVLLRTVSYSNIAADSLPIARAVKAANFDEIIASFAILSLGKDSNSVVIDVSSLFTTDVAILTINKPKRDAFKILALDASRSYIESAKSFPENIEVENVLTYTADASPQNPVARTASFAMRHSMVKLPENPMRPRLEDWRVGFFSTTKTDYGLPEQGAKQRSYILRWRLEPKDPDAYTRGELVEPKKPITMYIDPATPVQWRKYLKRGIEAWIPAFEAIGFKNAIRCLEPPTPQEDPDFSPEDVRYSVIRYYPSNIKNAVGPNIHDPRTGEILEADLYWFHNIMGLQQDWYFTQAVADPRARKLPLPDSLMGAMIEFVAAHEMGHSLGFPHNMKASNAYPVDSLRSKTFTEKYGTAPSIMDYARFNYVAQPGDNAAMMPKVGVYDYHALKYGYKVLPSAKTMEDELDTLRKWGAASESNKMLRFGFQQIGNILDPTSQTEDLGDDAMKATSYGLKNLERIMGYLADAATKKDDDYEEFRLLYEEVLAQWRREIGHVANYPGGVEVLRRSPVQNGAVYVPIPKAKQKEAITFLATNVLQIPTMFLRQDLLSRIQPTGTVKSLMDAQANVVRTLLSNDKLFRLMEQEAAGVAERYSVQELYNDVENALFSEIKQAKPQIDPYRRALQRVFVSELAGKFTAQPPAPLLALPVSSIFNLIGTPDVSASDVRAVTRQELENLKAACQSASGKAADAITKAHLKDLAVVIENTLNPKK